VERQAEEDWGRSTMTVPLPLAPGRSRVGWYAWHKFHQLAFNNWTTAREARRNSDDGLLTDFL
jgi:hypothetical protein